MKNLQEATERICELKGSLVALDALVPAIVRSLSPPARAQLMARFDEHAEAARTLMLHADISDLVLSGFERDFARHRALLQGSLVAGPSRHTGRADPLLRMTTRITTFSGPQALSSASGFFFRCGSRLFLVTNRHVLVDTQSGHHPDRIEIGLHTDAQDLTQYRLLPMPLFRAEMPQWREARDGGGEIDIAILEIPANELSSQAMPPAFEQSDLESGDEAIAIGDTVAIVGFPLGFHDTVYHLAVARTASMASAFGVRFQGQGCFLTDARTHSGSTGSPVVRRRAHTGHDGPSWQLIGVHSTRMGMRTQDQAVDESLGLNCAWYADVLPALAEAC